MANVEIGVALIKIEEALNWRLSSQSLREALVDNARFNIEVPDEYLVSWYGQVTVNDEDFVVKLIAGEP